MVQALQHVLDNRDLYYRDPHNTGIEFQSNPPFLRFFFHASLQYRNFENAIISKFNYREFHYQDAFSDPSHPDIRGPTVLHFHNKVLLKLNNDTESVEMSGLSG